MAIVDFDLDAVVLIADEGPQRAWPTFGTILRERHTRNVSTSIPSFFATSPMRMLAAPVVRDHVLSTRGLAPQVSCQGFSWSAERGCGGACWMAGHLPRR
jgi:hypothetical protein